MNRELLQRVRDQIASHPEEFDWTQYECGTAACIAGWACRLAGTEAGYAGAVEALDMKDDLGDGDDMFNFLCYASPYTGPDGRVWPSFHWQVDGEPVDGARLHAEALRRIDYVLSLEV
jgi:hypothetical protein